MQVIILAGGFGTRLQAVVPDLPKPMAPVAGRPFLAYLMQNLKRYGASRFILSVHYKRETIMGAFGEAFDGIPIDYAVEETPLGTGGGIANAVRFVTEDTALILNGDTFLDMDYTGFHEQAGHHNLTLALRHVPDVSRYGQVAVNDTHITHFAEKGPSGPGLINGGVYGLNVPWFRGLNLPQAFSMESDFFYPQVAELKPHYVTTEGYFLDIGVPEDYARAQSEIPLRTEL
ncbi:MAG: nucleotidyltransferase family protein [Alphaproteobacteria bacterium]